MKVATWNVNSLRVRLEQLEQWLDANPVDVVGLQELKLPDVPWSLKTNRKPTNSAATAA